MFNSIKFCSFHEKIYERLNNKEMIDIIGLKINNQYYAFLYNFRYNKNEYFYQSGIKLLSDRRFSPGIVITYLAICDSINRGYHYYDFLSGNEQYKRKLSNNVSWMYDQRIVRKNLKGTIFHSFKNLRKLIKSNLKKQQK